MLRAAACDAAIIRNCIEKAGGPSKGRRISFVSVETGQAGHARRQ